MKSPKREKSAQVKCQIADVFNIKMIETIIDIDNAAILNESECIGMGKVSPLEEVNK